MSENSTSLIDDIFQNVFLKEVKEKEKRLTNLNKINYAIAENKKAKLQEVTNFLNKFVNAQIAVNHTDMYRYDIVTRLGLEPQQFSYRVDDSKNQNCWPGYSVFIDHPANIEIGIPNDEDKMGVVLVSIEGANSYNYLLNKKFFSLKEFYTAFAHYISQSMVVNKNTID